MQKDQQQTFKYTIKQATQQLLEVMSHLAFVGA